MYVKLFADLLDSSLWAEDSDTRIVWLTLLMMAEDDGLVRASVAGISHRARVDYETTGKALALFEAPDKDSRTPDNEGRRIERVDGGYVILNYVAYRQTRDRAERRRKTAERVRQWRLRKVQSGETPCNAPVTQPVTPCNAPVTPVTLCNHIAEADAEAEADKEERHSASETAPAHPPPPHESFKATWNAQAKAAGIPECRTLTPKRRAALQARWRSDDWRAHWAEGLAKMTRTPFLCGHNDRGWKANLDWFLRPDSLTRILEGAYDHQARAGPTDDIDDLRARIEAREAMKRETKHD